MGTFGYPPDSKVESFDKFESYLLKLDQEDKESIIMGDIGERAGGARGAASPPKFGQLRVFGQQEKIWAKPVFKDVSMFIIIIILKR